MATTQEGTVVAADGFPLYQKSWQPSPASGTPKARLIWFHGFSDHCNNYDELFSSLVTHGIAVHAVDQRGWGRSVHQPSDRGATGPTETVLSDMTYFIRSLCLSDLPIFLGGHSMGAAQVLLWAVSGPQEIRRGIRGYILEAPFIRLHSDESPSRLVLATVRALSRWLPRLQLHHRQPLQWICRDQQVRREVARDPLVHNKGTLQGLAGMLCRAEELDAGLHDLRDTAEEQTRVWFGHGDEDRVVSINAAREYFERIQVRDKHFQTYRGCYHVLHKEPGMDKIRFTNDIVSWIDARSRP